MTEFGQLDKDGTYTHVASIQQSDMLKCPACIMMPEHYRPDGTCRHDDPDHKEMREWGYRWNKKRARWQ